MKDNFSPEELFALNNLLKRKDIVEIIDRKTLGFELLELGKKLAGKTIEADFLEEVTSDMIKSGIKGKKFRQEIAHCSRHVICVFIQFFH